jgi:hypothetical protein
MRLKSWLIAALGLGSLVVLIAVAEITLSHKAEDIYDQLGALNEHHREVEENLRRLRSDINLSGIFVRDYLLDVERERAPEYRGRIAQFRDGNMKTLQELRVLAQSDEEIASLESKLADYWETFDPLFDWTPVEKIAKSAAFLRHEVVPRRDAALALAAEIEELNNGYLEQQKAEAARQVAGFRVDLNRLLWQTLALGLVVAVGVVLRLLILERRSERAEHQRRELSQQLASAQEEERKHL